MNCPEHGRITVRSLGKSTDQNLPQFHGLIEEVTVLGEAGAPEWNVDGKGLHVRLGTGKREFPAVVRVK